MQHGTIDILKPLGLSEDACKYTLSPRSERAYSRINSEFDMLFQQLQPPDAKVGFSNSTWLQLPWNLLETSHSEAMCLASTPFSILCVQCMIEKNACIHLLLCVADARVCSGWLLQARLPARAWQTQYAPSTLWVGACLQQPQGCTGSELQ